MPTRETMERYFNETFPVGPVEAPAIANDKEIQRLIFDEQNELYKSMNHKITVIIGRKGSGKTSLLNSVSFENDSDNTLIVPLDSIQAADVFSRIVEEIDDLASDTAFVEQVSNIWEVLIWGVVFKLLFDLYQERSIGMYIDGFGIQAFKGSPYEMIDKQLSIIKEFPPAARPVAQKVRYTKVNGVAFLEARDIAIELLSKKKQTVFVLMDSLENYTLHKNQNSAALAGLLRCVGKLTAERIPLVFRCCVPAEKYHELMRLSQNPIKDFQGSMLLHWDAGELVKLSAQRYAHYLEYYDKDIYEKHVRALDLDDRKDAFKFWDLVFPKEVTNKNGVSERPIAYILRHTQLLPRHILLILTEILRRSIKLDQQPFNIKPYHITDGIFEAEGMIKDQILQAYRTPLEHAEVACQQLLRELPSRFTWQDFDTVVARRRDSIASLDRWELMALLIEVGAVGKFITATDKYFVAMYEYMVPHRLNVSLRDTFCVHPLFTVTYGVNTKYPGAKPVYTYWSENIPDELV